MKPQYLSCCAILLTAATTTVAKANDWSIVPYTGLSFMQDQSLNLVGLGGGLGGDADLSLEGGFVAGLSARVHYDDSRWISEFGWEYRSNDATITAEDGSRLPGGNYASNIFYLNGRYRLVESQPITPWLGVGLLWTQEVDLDSENTSGERSFSDSGSIGYQLMAGADYDLSEQFYLTGEIRYSTQHGLELSEETGNGAVTEVDYQSLTMSLGVGYRF